MAHETSSLFSSCELVQFFRCYVSYLCATYQINKLLTQRMYFTLFSISSLQKMFSQRIILQCKTFHLVICIANIYPFFLNSTSSVCVRKYSYNLGKSIRLQIIRFQWNRGNTKQSLHLFRFFWPWLVASIVPLLVDNTINIFL